MSTLQKLRTWLDAPDVLDDESRRRVALCNLIFRAGTLFLVMTLLLWPFVATSPNSEQYLIISMALLVGLVLSKLILNQGHIREAEYLIATTFWVTFAFAALVHPDGMVGTPFFAVIAITPILSGFVVGTKASVLVTVINWGLGGYMTWLDVMNPASVPYSEEPVVRYIILMIMVSAFPIIVYVWHRNLREALTQVRISEQARAETAAYRVQNEALEAAVAARTQALEQSLVREQRLGEKLALALEAETRLGEMQSRIITVVSHEFRTPLSVINSSSEILRQYYDRLPPERREAAHQRINDAIFYLNDLLKDVTLVDKAQRARIQPSYQSFAFNELCQQLIKRINREVSDASRLQFHFVPELKTAVQTDFNLLEQIVNHLISNALKYSAEETDVHVHFWVDGMQICLEVRDSGIGIPLAEQAKVCDLFYRGSNVDERRGLGLGLFIVQAIIQLMQGSLHLSSKGNGQGAVFEVSLPLASEFEGAVAETAS